MQTAPLRASLVNVGKFSIFLCQKQLTALAYNEYMYL